MTENMFHILMSDIQKRISDPLGSGIVKTEKPHNLIVGNGTRKPK